MVEDGSDGLEMCRKVFIGGFAVLCKLLRVGHHLNNHWHCDLSL